ncbi:MAG TPA: 23S rRNA (guanosine(2251)-2'-O)-methyltransferase RlmB [Acidimicrobiales bacterium]|nr:23S rRNA (guanosine(2251)-2'-O)-methyltransferase RlmB [Acidimicrobiales bacterium]
MSRGRSSRSVGLRQARSGRSEAGPARRPRGNAPVLAGGLGGDQIEGRQAVRELLRSRARAIDVVYVVADRAPSPTLSEVIELADERGVLRMVSSYEIDAMARSDAPQGVIARAEPLRAATLEELVEPAGGHLPFLVVFDGVTDPHNLGAVLRSALSAGATGAVLARRRSVHVTPVVAKVAAGAIEYMPIALVAGIPSALSDLKTSGIWTVGLDADGERSVDELPVSTEPIALVFGAEGRGLSPLTRNRCEIRARIDLFGPLESINVSAAAAISCFAVARQRSAGS